MCSCLQWPQLSGLVRFLLWERSMAFHIVHRLRICLIDRADLICGLYSQWEGLGSSSLATQPLSFNCGFIPTSACGSSTGVCSWGCPGGLGLPLWGPGVEVVQLLGRRGSGNTTSSGAWRRLGQREMQCSRRVWQPALDSMPQSSCLENPLPDREAWQATVYRVAKSWTRLKQPCAHRDKTVFLCRPCPSEI